MVTAEQRRLYQSIQDPEVFLREVLGDDPYDKQVEMMDAAARSRRISVVGANSSGKDWTAGRVVHWWQNTRYPAKTIVTGPSTRQVHDIVWNEVKDSYLNARTAFKSRLYQGGARLQFNQEHFALGFSTDQPYNLQGFHSPNLLVIVTEAHAMGQAHINALRRLNPSCMLLVGNAFATSGEFYDSHHINRGLYSTVEISAFDTPNVKAGCVVVPGMVTKEDVADRLEEWGEGNPLYIAGVLGKFPDSLDDTIVPLSDANAARARVSHGEGPRIVAVDVARYGRDKTVVVRRQGNVARIVWRVQGRNLMEIVGWLTNYIEERPIDFLIIDDTGVGGGVTDRLGELDLGDTQVVAFNGGSTAEDSERYYNAISEAWMLMRKWFLETPADIENDNALIGQITSRGFTYQSDKRLRIQSKKDMARSPDEADALAMTFAPTGGEFQIWV